MNGFISYLAYLLIGGMIGYGVRSILNIIYDNKKIDKMNKRLSDWQELEEKMYNDKKNKKWGDYV